MDFITGNKFKKICNHSYDEKGYIVHSDPHLGELLKIFVKIDYVHNFFKLKQERPYVLFTHNGDLPVDNSYLKYLDNPYLVKWYGQNIMTNHPKLQSIPIGIANEIWPHGNEDIFKTVINQNNVKEQLIYVNFDIKTNKNERNYCISELIKKGLEMQPRLSFDKYLEKISKSYFIVSPNGNGVDCHKIWESLYLKTIPIVTKSININFYRNLPIIIIDNWSEFDLKNLSIDLYNKIWDNFDINNLYFDKYVKMTIYGEC